MSDRIWFAEPTVESLNAERERQLSGRLGIEFIEVGEDYVRASMPVDRRTHQPMGLLHGGATAALAETVGSVAANLCVDMREVRFVGLEINVNHLRAVRSGTVTGTARPLHRGRSTQVWNIEIHDDDGRLCAVSRLTLAAVKAGF